MSKDIAKQSNLNTNSISDESKIVWHCEATCKGYYDKNICKTCGTVRISKYIESKYMQK